MPSRFYIIPSDVNLSINISIHNSFITSHQFDCLLLALYDDGHSGVLNRVHAQRLHVLPSSLFAMSSKCVSDVMVKWKMKSWTVTRVIMWLLCDHGVEASKAWVFVAHFIHLFNADAVHRRTLRSPDVTLLTQAGWYGLSGFEFPVAGHSCVQNVTQACLFAKCTTPVQYI